MIYLDFSKKLQVIYIPKNGDYTGKIEDTPTFEEGYDKGYQDGLEDCECGECPPCNEGSKYHTVKTDVETLYASVDGLDGYNMVEINASEFGENRYNLGYEQGYEQGKSDVGCNVGFKYHIVKDDIETINAAEYGYDGYSEVEIYAAEYGNKKYEEGYEQGKSEGGEGGSCNIQETKWVHPSINDIDENGYLVYYKDDGYDGMDRIALQMDNYNQEIGGGGNCNIGKLEEQLDANDDGHIVRYAVDYGLDGWYYIDLDVNQYGNRKYEEGYNQGKSECGEGGSCNLGDLNVEWDAGWNVNNFYAEREGLDGYKSVSINAERALQEKYDEGYNQGKSECPELTELNVTENGTYEGSFNKVNVSVTATDFSSEQVENKYSHLSFITKNVFDKDTVVDKTKLLNRAGNYIENSTINFTYDKIGICLAMGQRYLNPDSTTNDTVIRVIEDGAIDWNNVDIFRSYRITRFGENMTRDKNSNLSELYIQASTFTDDIVIFEDGCFATSNRLNKIVFLEPFRVNVKGNPFEGISSQGKFIVKGLMINRDKYTDLINLLPTDWEVIFNPDYEE